MKRIDLHMSVGEDFALAMKAIKNAPVLDYYVQETRRENRAIITVVAHNGDSQLLIDNLRTILHDHGDWRVVLSEVIASTPELPERTEASVERGDDLLREQLYKDAHTDAKISADYFLLIVLSTIVAAIGLNSDSAAAVIGSMVIAPLLGPVMALVLGTALGDDRLLFRAFVCISVGLLLCLGISFALAQFLSINLDSHELTQRGRVGLDGIALAIAAGVAAAISRLTGVGAGLVGVMVAAALLPSGAAAGLFAAADRWDLAARAALLMLLNVFGLILAAVIVFRMRKITPHRDFQQHDARRAVWVSAIGLGVLIVGASFLIIFLDLGNAVNVE